MIKSTKFKILNIRIVERGLEEISFQISGQAPFFKDFKHYKTGILISSRGCPEWRNSENTLCIRGFVTTEDWKTVTVSKKVFEKITQAINSLNRHHGLKFPRKNYAYKTQEKKVT